MSFSHRFISAIQFSTTVKGCGPVSSKLVRNKNRCPSPVLAYPSPNIRTSFSKKSAWGVPTVTSELSDTSTAISFMSAEA